MNSDGIRRLGPLEVSSIGLGCMSMSEFYGSADEQGGLATIDRALDLGVSFFDTADMYGEGDNERLLGRAARGRRHRMIIATKFGILRDASRPAWRGFDGSPAYARRACEASLLRLGIETIDLYYLHRADPAIPIEESVGAMAALVAEGKVRAIGLSEVDAPTLERAHAVHPVAALQSEYSLWTRDPEEEILPTCARLGIGFVPFAPLGRGFLTGALRTPDDFDADDFRRNSPRFQGENFARNLTLVALVRDLAEARGCTPAQLALAWLLARGEGIVPIPGTKQVQRLEENAAARDIHLTADEVGQIEKHFPLGVAAGPRYAAGAATAPTIPPAR